jgi:signal transduction histidine kinase
MSFYHIILYLIIFSLVLLIIIFWRRITNQKLVEDRERFLIAFEKLYTIMASAITLEETAQKLADVLAFELGFQAGVLSLIDRKEGTLKRIAVSHTKAGLIGLKMLPIPYKAIGISLNRTENILIQAIRDKSPKITNNMHDLFVPILDLATVSKLQKTMGIRTSFVYPIISNKEVLGTMIFSIAGEKNDLPNLQKEAIRRVMEVVGIVIERVYLYEQLRVTTKDLETANNKLRELDKLKDDFVSIASHELRTPMTAIRSYSWMALYKSDVPLSEKMKKYLTRTLVSTERLINLVNDMLNISRIESGRIEISPKAFDMKNLVQDVFDEVVEKVKEKNIHLVSDNTQVPHVFADPDKVHQVLLNLVGNAMKFTPNDGQIKVSFFSDGQMLEIRVQDSGVGISKDDLSRLFKKFGRLDNSYVAAATSGGTGLGLYISKSLIELMKGKIWASSEGTGKGTTFTFTLPIATSEVLTQKSRYEIRVQGEAKPLEPMSI